MSLGTTERSREKQSRALHDIPSEDNRRLRQQRWGMQNRPDHSRRLLGQGLRAPLSLLGQREALSVSGPKELVQLSSTLRYLPPWPLPACRWGEPFLSHRTSWSLVVQLPSGLPFQVWVRAGSPIFLTPTVATKMGPSVSFLHLGSQPQTQGCGEIGAKGAESETGTQAGEMTLGRRLSCRPSSVHPSPI